MNRNVILAAAVALVAGLWGGLVLARVGGAAGPSFLGGVPNAERVRAADAPRLGPQIVDGIAFMALRIDTDGDAPKACLEFSEPLSKDPNVNFGDFLALDPAAPVNVEPNGQLLCLAGLPYDVDRQLTIKAGLPAASGEVTARDETITLSFGDRPAFVGFAGSGTILPRAEADGLGIETVNVSQLEIEVLRVGDRALTREEIEQGQSIAEGSWDWWTYEDAAQSTGVSVFKGKLDVALVDPQSKRSRRNETITTVFPLGATLKELKAGAYVVKVKDASPSAGARGQDSDRAASAYRWVITTDMALQTFSGATGLDIVVRSLKTARPVSGVSLVLVAESNEVLARARTDGDGRARFAKPVMDGTGPLRPKLVMAYGAGGDFTALDVDRTALDLSDKDVDGRRTPGDVDAYMFTERGVYRPGETVRLNGMIRDAAGRAITNRQSVLVVYRPNGTEARRQRLERAVEAGAVLKSFALDKSAPRGRWRATLEVDGQEGAAGEVSFAVEDFVPQRLKVDVTASEAPLRPGETRMVDVAARFLYGASGAGLAVEGEARLAVDANPFPDAKGFAFGRIDESFDEQFIQLTPSVTDGDGKAQLAFSLANPPQTTLPLRARLVATVMEPGGRTVREGFQIPVRLQDRYIGVKPAFENGQVAEGARAAFDVIAVDPAGRRIAAKGVAWTLVAEEWSYDWYLDGGQWRWRRTGRDVPVATGVVDIPADKPAQVARDKMRDGQFRLILSDAASGAQTSTRFYAGWGSSGGDDDAPDTVAVVPPVDAVKVGSNVRVQIKPPYAGEAQIAIATDRVLSMKTMRVPAEGATLNLRADPSWGSGVYVLVTVMTPRSPATLPVPRRAVGVTYVPIDMGPRTLKVALPEKQVLRPRQTVQVPVTIAGAPNGEKVRMTLAAVDEGILQLTKFDSPDPAKFYFGRKALGVSIRDDYGRLLNPNLGAAATPRQGGDGLGGEGLTVVPTKTVALWSGLVQVGKDGKAQIPLELPDFNGELRLMAVAWSESAVGADAEAATVRDPVVAELTLPRFIAPGDTASATLELSNVEGPAGAYRVTVSPSGAVSGAAFSQTFNLAAKAQTRVRVPLKGDAAGIGQVLLAMEGPGGVKVSRSYQIQSRTPFMPLTLTQTQSQAAGTSYTLSPRALDDFAAGEGKALVSYSPLRGVDAAPLLDVLNRYPYGCSEQLTSTTLPLLYANALAQTAQKPSDPQLRRRVQETIDKLLDRQGSDGAFGLWRAEDRAASPWLGAYVTDFLRRAKAAGYVVPNAPLDAAYKALRSVARLDDFGSVSYDFEVYAWPGNTDSKERMRSRSAAYALYVLAKAGKADLGQVRYFHDAKLKSEESPLARAQIGAALAHLGDRARAKNAFRLAEQALGYRNTGDYYQTPLRDLSGVLALAAEAGEGDLVERLSARLERDNREAESLTTQEQAALLVAVDALLARTKGPLAITANGAPMMGPVAVDAARVAQGVVFANAGQGPAFRTLTISGTPRTAPGPTSQGFSLEKRLFRMNGAAADTDGIRQGDRVIVVLRGATQGERLHPAVLVDLLPAGLEIESVLKPEDGAASNPETADGPFAWIGRITSPRIAEARDDRFVAAADLRSETFTFAYVARAVTPGSYTLPAAQIEDMYRPGVIGRTAVGRVGVAPGG